MGAQCCKVKKKNSMNMVSTINNREFVQLTKILKGYHCVVCRTVCCRSGGEQDASLLSFWRYSQYYLTHGVHGAT